MKGQPGFPLKWDQRQKLFLKALSKDPAKPWPSDVFPIPYGDGGLEVHQIARDTIYLSPDWAYDPKPSGQMYFFNASTMTWLWRGIFILPKRLPMPIGLKRWSDSSQVSTSMQILKPNGSRAPSSQGKSVLQFNKEEYLSFRVRPQAFISKANSSAPQRVMNIRGRLRLRDAAGNWVAEKRKQILTASDTRNESDFNVSVLHPGIYTVELDLLAPEGRTLQTRSGTQRMKVYISRPTSGVFEPGYGPWTLGPQPYTWQRMMRVDTASGALSPEQINGLYSFKIVPLQGFPNDKRVSWLSSSLTGKNPSGDGQSIEGKLTGVVQYYRADPKNFPDDASRQMDIYTVAVTEASTTSNLKAVTIQ